MRITKTPSYATAALDAVREELAEAGRNATITAQRLGVRLGEADVRELRSRLAAIASEFAERDDPDGAPIGLLLMAHRRRA